MGRDRRYEYYSSSLDGPLSKNRASQFQVELFRDYQLQPGVRSGLSLSSIAVPKETLLKNRDDFFEKNIVELCLRYSFDCTLTSLLLHFTTIPSDLLQNVDLDVSGLPQIMIECLKRVCYAFKDDYNNYPDPWDPAWTREFKRAVESFQTALSTYDRSDMPKMGAFLDRLNSVLRGEYDDNERAARGEMLWKEERDARMAWENDELREECFKKAKMRTMSDAEKTTYLAQYEAVKSENQTLFTTLKVKYLARAYLQKQLVLIGELEGLKEEKKDLSKHVIALKKKQQGTPSEAVARDVRVASARISEIDDLIEKKEGTLQIVQTELQLSGDGLTTAYQYTTRDQGTFPRANTRQGKRPVEQTVEGAGKRVKRADFSPVTLEPLEVDWVETVAPVVVSNMFFVTLPCLGPEYEIMELDKEQLSAEIFRRYKKMLRDMEKKSLLSQVMHYTSSSSSKNQGWIEAVFGLDASRYKEAHLIAPREFFQAFNFHSYEWTYENPSISVSSFRGEPSVTLWLHVDSILKTKNFAAEAEYEPIVFLECKQLASNKIGGFNRPILKLIPTEGIRDDPASSFFFYEAGDSCSIIPFVTNNIRFLDFSLRGVKGDVLTGSSVSYVGREHLAPTLLSFTVHEDY